MEVLLELQNCYFHHKYHIRENGYNSIRVSKSKKTRLGFWSKTPACLEKLYVSSLVSAFGLLSCIKIC